MNGNVSASPSVTPHENTEIFQYRMVSMYLVDVITSSSAHKVFEMRNWFMYENKPKHDPCMVCVVACAMDDSVCSNMDFQNEHTINERACLTVFHFKFNEYGVYMCRRFLNEIQLKPYNLISFLWFADNEILKRFTAYFCIHKTCWISEYIK